MSHPTVYCSSCGTENDERLQRCTSCGAWLDPAVAAATHRSERPTFDPKAFGIAAAIAVVLVVVAQAVGLTFSMAVLPASDSMIEHFEHLDALVEAEAIEPVDATSIEGELVRTEALRAELAAGRLDADEAMRARERLRPPDQSVVLGLGGYAGLLPPFVAFVLAGVAATMVVRARRVTEVALGVTAGVVAQLGAWLFVADFHVAAVTGGELIMLQTGLGFAGAPIMLLGMTLVLSVGAAVVVANVTARFLEPARARTAKLRYRGGDDDLAQLGRSPGGTTLASSGASELLCLRCAKAYAADQCPVHPHEPLLDPRLDAVRFQLMELDMRDGTRRFSQWTSDGLGVDAALAAAASTGPLLCMECARTYDAQHCPIHPQEPLLDPSTEAVRLELIAADDRARARASTGLMFGAAAVAILASFGFGMAVDADASLTVGVFAGLLVGLVTVSRVVAPKLAPPRFSAWTGEGHVDLDEFGMGAKATIFAPLRRALARARARSLQVLLASLAGAAAGAGLAFAVSWPIAAIAFAGALVSALATVAILATVDQARDLRGAVRTAQRAWNDPYATDHETTMP